MKRKINYFRHQVLFFFVLMMSTIIALAQDGGGSKDVDASVNVTKTTTTATDTWYTQPWVLIVGGLVFILLLIALLRGRGSKS